MIYSSKILKYYKNVKAEKFAFKNKTITVNIKPIFYAYWFLNFALKNGSICNNPTLVNNNNVSSYVLKTANSYNVVILHMNVDTGNIEINVNKMGSNVQPALLYRLVCKDGLGGKSGITFGNHTLDGNRLGIPNKCSNNTISQTSINPTLDSERINLVNNKYTFKIATTSAVILSIPI